MNDQPIGFVEVEIDDGLNVQNRNGIEGSIRWCWGNSCLPWFLFSLHCAQISKAAIPTQRVFNQLAGGDLEKPLDWANRMKLVGLRNNLTRCVIACEILLPNSRQFFERRIRDGTPSIALSNSLIAMPSISWVTPPAKCMASPRASFTYRMSSL